jgi:LacI family transcriptional regulator
MKEIARLAGVSAATVSNVLNGNEGKASAEVSAKIMDIVQQTGYVPNHIAKSLRKRQTNTVGVITEDIRSFQTPGIITGINTYMETAQKRILLYDMAVMQKIGTNVNRMTERRADIEEALDILLNAQVDGIIYVAMQDRDIGELVRQTDIPLVYAYCYSERDDRTWVSYDNMRVMRDILDKAIALGHRNIAVAWGGEGCRPAQQRLEVYKNILQEHGMPFREEYTRHGDWSFEDGIRFYREFMELEEPPTALVFMNDEMAIGALDESMRADRKVLDEISVVGFNNMEYMRFTTPRLSSVQIPLEEIGREAAEQLVKHLNDPCIPAAQIILDCRYIERGSLRACKG